MNYHALLKLKRNPHYKMNQKQIEELAKYENDPVVLFGVVEKHENTFEQHPVKVRKSYGK